MTDCRIDMRSILGTLIGRVGTLFVTVIFVFIFKHKNVSQHGFRDILDSVNISTFSWDFINFVNVCVDIRFHFPRTDNWRQSQTLLYTHLFRCCKIWKEVQPSSPLPRKMFFRFCIVFDRLHVNMRTAETDVSGMREYSPGTI